MLPFNFIYTGNCWSNFFIKDVAEVQISTCLSHALFKLIEKNVLYRSLRDLAKGYELPGSMTCIMGGKAWRVRQ